MRREYYLAVLVIVAASGVTRAAESVTFENGKGTHVLKINDRGVIIYSLNEGRPYPINDKTAAAKDGNRLANVVAVSGTGFKTSDDIHVVAVDKDGDIWHTVRLVDGTWLRWGSVKDQVSFTGKAVNVTCFDQTRRLVVRVFDAAGNETKITRHPDGTWSE